MVRRSRCEAAYWSLQCISFALVTEETTATITTMVAFHS